MRGRRPFTHASRGAFVHAVAGRAADRQAIHRLEEGANLHDSCRSPTPCIPTCWKTPATSSASRAKAGAWSVRAGGRTGTPRAGVQELRRVHAATGTRTPLLLLVRQPGPASPYEPGTGARAGLKPESVRVPRFLPDTADVRQDLLDYYFEVQRFDRDLGRLLEALERAGELDHTIVVVTSDNGMPFPGQSHRVRRWCARSTGHPMAGCRAGGGRIDELVSLADSRPPCLRAQGCSRWRR